MQDSISNGDRLNREVHELRQNVEIMKEKLLRLLETVKSPGGVSGKLQKQQPIMENNMTESNLKHQINNTQCEYFDNNEAAETSEINNQQNEYKFSPYIERDIFDVVPLENKGSLLESPFLDAYERMGWETVPVSITSERFKKFPTFPKNWTHRSFTRHDFGAEHNGILIKTGKPSNLMGLDFDLGRQELKTLLDKYGLQDIFQRHPCVLTPSGGMHVYLSNEHSKFWKERYGRNSLTTTNAELRVDVRADGAGLFAPPTDIPGLGEYNWINHPESLSTDYRVDDFVQLMDDVYKYKPYSKPAREFLNIYEPHKQFEPTEYYDDYEKAHKIITQLCQAGINYNDWIRMGLAIYARFGEGGKPLWDLFMTNPYYNDTQRQMDSHWYSFRSVNKTSLGTLFYLAQKYNVYNWAA